MRKYPWRLEDDEDRSNYLLTAQKDGDKHILARYNKILCSGEPTVSITKEGDVTHYRRLGFSIEGQTEPTCKKCLDILNSPGFDKGILQISGIEIS